MPVWERPTKVHDSQEGLMSGSESIEGRRSGTAGSGLMGGIRNCPMAGFYHRTVGNRLLEKEWKVSRILNSIQFVKLPAHR